MGIHAKITGASALTRRRKAAMIVQMLISDGGALSLSDLPDPLQELLTRELGAIRLVDRDTVSAVAEEFVTELETIGLSAPGTRDGAITALADHLSPALAEKLRAQMDAVRNGDHWPRIIDLSVERIVPIMTAESIEICAVVLSKLPVRKAAEVLVKTPGDRARRITYAMSQTAKIAPETVRKIGAALAHDYGTPKPLAFENAPVQRLGAILNATATDTREDVLEGLGAADPDFADDVRRAIFTFKDIAPRVKPTDIPNCLRSVDNDVMATAVAAALAGEPAMVESAEYILKNLSQRMATQLREDAAERGRIKKAEAETAMATVTTAIRDLVETGIITLRDPETEEDADS
ncbi:FliG C-terminal domain-containing protein [Yoonia sp.]|uniref:FliG C-terminal domain-containing protein n=1 Tax=Yoonia sp. TaxID=2212373 RepID=UPI0019F4B578|nr:FliG C-terminal domain-containing protein [Yoonia sp.]MBE0414146.1 flagellar motor switch protein FliG [Yoonia sp.]